MSYTPTQWESDDIVTASRMNALEQAVGEMNMSYTPNTWSDGDILTAAKMNALEQAVASGGGGGSSDFSTAEVTITLAKTNSYAEWFAPMIRFEELGVMFSLETESAAVSDSFTVVLYNNNSCSLEFFDSEDSTYTNISVTGDIAVDDGYVTISGNGTITIS